MGATLMSMLLMLTRCHVWGSTPVATAPKQDACVTAVGALFVYRAPKRPRL